MCSSDLVGFTPPAPGGKENRVAYKLEELPGYKQLPDTREESYKLNLVDRNKIRLLLPTHDSSHASKVIFSKEEAQEWLKEFMSRWKPRKGETEFRFAINTIGNPEIVNAEDEYYEWKDISTKNILSFYKSLKYKGD